VTVENRQTIVIMQGDQTGQELLDEALRVLSTPILPPAIDFQVFDLSLDKRRATKNQIVYDAAEAVKKHGFGLKAATITPAIRRMSAAPTRSCARRVTPRSFCAWDGVSRRYARLQVCTRRLLWCAWPSVIRMRKGMARG